MQDRDSQNEQTAENLPLRGIKVVEAAQGVAGPFCGRFLAALGAKVIKVERPPEGDWSRKIGPFLPGNVRSECSALYLYNNMGKESVLLDWETESGMSALETLVSSADILIEDWDRAYREEIGLTTDRFTSMNSELILKFHVSIARALGQVAEKDSGTPVTSLTASINTSALRRRR